jgi:hypothetical protein
MSSPAVPCPSVPPCLHSRRVEIRVQMHAGSLDADLLHVVGPMLEYTEHEFPSDGRGLIAKERHLWVVNDSGRLEIAVGCVPRVAAELRRQGYDVTVVDERVFDGPDHQINEAAYDEADETVRRFLDAVRANPRGVAETAPRQVQYLIGHLCSLFRRARILIPQAGCEDTLALAAKLLPFVGGEVEAVHNSEWGSRARVVCCTFASFHSATEPDLWKIVVFPNADHMEWCNKTGTIGRFLESRVYAFMDPRRPRDLREERRIEAISGPTIFSTRRPRPSVRVLFVTPPLGPMHPGTSALERKRALWGSVRRNEAIAAVATAFAHADLNRLWEHGLLLEEDRIPAGDGAGLRVAILAESAEHAMEIHRRLPDWHLLHAIPQSPDPNRGRLQGWDRWINPQRTIITAVRAEQMKYFATDVLILAAGGDRPLLPRRFPGYLGVDQPERQVLVVDFADDFNRVARAAVEHRRQEYRRLGYTVGPVRTG